MSTKKEGTLSGLSDEEAEELIDKIEEKKVLTQEEYELVSKYYQDIMGIPMAIKGFSCECGEEYAIYVHPDAGDSSNYFVYIVRMEEEGEK